MPWMSAEDLLDHVAAAALGSRTDPRESDEMKGVRWMGFVALVYERLNSEEGATAVEYALMVALIAMVIIAAAAFVGSSTNTLFPDVGSAVSST
jgi:pilus assembly protein Flp/PilA